MNKQVFFTRRIAIKYERGKVFPLFVPFAGCPFQCIFCSQEKQTGKGKQSVEQALEQAYRDFPVFLENYMQQNQQAPNKTIDIAFYGGTFTAIDEKDFLACLDFFADCKKRAKEKNFVLLGRCSTRPDALDEERLEHLKNTGINLIELGIQSFDDNVLAKSKRGYTKELAKKACKKIQEFGFDLGIQLMAGLPEQNEAVFIKDAIQAIHLNPDCMRYYPCLVPAGTVLATYFQKNEYQPWTDEQCIKTLGNALYLAWKKNIPVIRLTVAPEKEFDNNLLGGPRHPSLGSDIMAHAIYTLIKEETQNSSDKKTFEQIRIPEKYLGCFYGTKNRLKKSYACLTKPEIIVFCKNQEDHIKFIHEI